MVCQCTNVRCEVCAGRCWRLAIKAAKTPDRLCPGCAAEMKRQEPEEVPF